MKTSDVVIFDLDDTLYFEKKYVESGYRNIANICAEFLKKPDQDFYSLLMEVFSSERRGKEFNVLLDKYPALKQEFSVEKLIEIYRKHEPEIDLNAGARDLFEQLLKDGVRLGLITDGFFVSQKNKIKALSLDNWFTKIIATDFFGKDYWKPDSRSFSMMEEEFGKNDNARYWYIGDNPEKDFIAPNLKGWNTVRYRNPEQIRFSLNPPSQLHESKYEADSYTNIFKLISNNYDY